MAGVYFDDSLHGTAGFIGRPGALTTFSVPGSSQTFPRSLNDQGVVVGQYYDSRNIEHGFVYNPDGKFTTVDAPGSAGTALSGINNAGQIVGEGFGYGGFGGFLYSSGTFSSFFGGSPLSPALSHHF